MSILMVILALGVLIAVHELGHFIAAKLSGVMVKEFSIGFWKPIFQKEIGETTYSLRILPLGGYVRMLGEDEKEDEDPRSLNNQGKFKRLMIFSAGVTFNLIFGILLLLIVNMHDKPYMKSTIKVNKDFPAAKVLLDGDEIVGINGSKVGSWSEVVMQLIMATGSPSKITVLRDGDKNTFTVIPVKDKEGKWLIGIMPAGEVGTKEGMPFDSAFIAAVKYPTEFFILNIKGIGMLFSGKLKAKDSVAGPVGIVAISTKVVDAGLVASLHWMALISLILAFMNSLPIPVLDGGHMMFLGLEAIRGKPLSRKITEKIQIIFFMMLIGLALFVTYFDILRLIGN